MQLAWRCPSSGRHVCRLALAVLAVLPLCLRGSPLCCFSTCFDMQENLVESIFSVNYVAIWHKFSNFAN
jgi:hypothetical protein